MSGAAAWRGLALLAALWAAACGGRHDADDKAAAVPAASSDVFVVEERLLPDYKPVAAILTNRDAGAARARIAGTLTKLSVRAGDAVNKGDVLAIVSDDRRTLETNAAAADVAAAKARAERASAEFARVKDLFDNGVYAQARLDTAKAEAESAKAGLRASLARRDALKEASDQGAVLAPAEGRVTRAPIPEGAVVMPGEIVAEVATGKRVLRIELPEAEARAISEGTEIMLAVVGHGETASVLQVYPAIENGKVIVDIDAKGFDDAFVGVRTPVLVPIGVRPTIVIPSAFVSTRYGVDYVRLLRPDGTTIDAPVQLGARLPAPNGEAEVEILSGLRAGDRLLPSAATKETSVTALADDRP
ncbi:MAG: efflux RND transporter periplasmic adaptor subunit [Amphiplicatus sp.]